MMTILINSQLPMKWENILKNKKYVTVKNVGLGLHDIAKVMTDDGDKMNHSTARNVYVKALMKIASEVTELYNVDMDQKKLKKIAINPEFQETIRDFMDELDCGIK